MKILVLTSTLPAAEDDPVPSFVRDQAIALKQFWPDLQITILAPHTRRTRTAGVRQLQHYEEIRFGYFRPVRLERLADGGIVPNLQRHPWLILQVPFLWACQVFATWRLFRRKRPDVLYAHWFTPQGITCALIGRITGTPFVFTSHSMDVFVLRRFPILGPLLVRWGIRQAAAFSAVSRKTLSKIQYFFNEREWATMSGKARIIPMGTFASPHSSTQSEHSHQNELLFIGRLVEKKGVSYLLDALALVKNHRRSFHLNICGTGPQHQRLQTQIEQLNLENDVSLRGYVTGAEKQGIFELCGTVIVPSVDTPDDTEGLPVAALESMAHGKVVIVSDESGGNEIIEHEVNGYLVKSRDSQALAAQIISVIDQDRQENRAIRRNAVQSAQRFSWPRIAERTVKHLFGDAVITNRQS